MTGIQLFKVILHLQLRPFYIALKKLLLTKKLLTFQLFLRIFYLFLPQEILPRDFEWFRHNQAFSDFNSTNDILISAVKLAVKLAI